MILSALQPQPFFTHFEAISQIPRGSGNEKAVSDHVLAFARNLGYEAVQDELHNVIIYKPASPGCENRPAVILQGHLDMVNEKNAGTEHDFTKDPLRLYVDGDFVKARGTTLGADNGTAVAMCMALLEDKTLKHPALEMVLTTEEEVGMAGAMGLDAGLLSATRMINLDASEEKVVVIGCAAGVTVDYALPAVWEGVPEGMAAYTLTVTGLRGGHSGADIHKERGNALVILGCMLEALENDCDVRVAEISGGMKLNAIPREAEAKILVPAGQGEGLKSFIAKYHHMLGYMYHKTEPGLAITCAPSEVSARVLSRESVYKIINSLLLLPNGVLAMSQDMPGLVASSCNVGVLETGPDGVHISCFPRGATQYHVRITETQIRALSALTGAKTRFVQRSPAWAYNPDSALLKTVVECYERQNGGAPGVTALHAGLECGIFAEKMPGLDIVAMGPDTFDLHTPDERLSVPSLGRTWALLLKVLEVL
jgi:dipeptidase D